MKEKANLEKEKVAIEKDKNDVAKELAQVSSTFDQAKKDHQAHTEASRRDLLAHIQKEKEDNEK